MTQHLTRDEVLFWRLIDLYAQPLTDGPSGGLIYRGYGENAVSPNIEVFYLVTGAGVLVRMCTNIDIPQGKVLDCTEFASRFFDWNSFSFDDFISWVEENGNWEKAVNRLS